VRCIVLFDYSSLAIEQYDAMSLHPQSIPTKTDTLDPIERSFSSDCGDAFHQACTGAHL
jgi:hypothetical protein